LFECVFSGHLAESASDTPASPNNHYAKFSF
jgi:hypothetical protein